MKYKTALNFKMMTREEQEFYAGFETVQDHLTIEIQLNKIKNEMTKKLIAEHGKIVPKQSRYQLIEKFKNALDALGY